MIAKNIYLNF